MSNEFEKMSSSLDENPNERRATKKKLDEMDEIVALGVYITLTQDIDVSLMYQSECAREKPTNVRNVVRRSGGIISRNTDRRSHFLLVNIG